MRHHRPPKRSHSSLVLIEAPARVNGGCRPDPPGDPTSRLRRLQCTDQFDPVLGSTAPQSCGRSRGAPDYALAMQILVVDDHPAIRNSLQRSLQYNGYQVTTADDGLRALAQLAAHRPDAVIMDVMMPWLDGLEATRMLRAAGNDVPILLLTACDAIDDRVDGLDAGGDDYLANRSRWTSCWPGYAPWSDALEPSRTPTTPRPKRSPYPIWC